MGNNEYKIDLNKYTLGYDAFVNAEVQYLKSISRDRSFDMFIPKPLKDYYRFAPGIQNVNYSLLDFIIEIVNENKESNLNFLQSLIDYLLINTNKHTSNIYDLHLENIINIFNIEIFNLDFYFDKDDYKIKNKLDEGTADQINTISQNLNDSNKNLYETCVAEFIEYNKGHLTKQANDYYHESLDKMTDLIQIVLASKFDNTKISQKDKVTSILFDGKNEEMKSVLDFVIKKIHHDVDSERTSISEKEYLYIWLELNKILYLLNRYSR